MTARGNTVAAGFDVLLAGVFPPPVHGASVANQALADFLTRAGHALETHRTTAGGKGWAGRALGRFAASLRLSRRLAGSAGSGEGVKVVMSLSGGSGLFFDLLNLLLCRLLRRDLRLAFAHHSYAYCRRRSPWMTLLVRLSPGAAHIFLAQRMQVDFEACYGKVAEAHILGNSWLVPQAPAPAGDGRTPGGGRSIVIGQLSNLSFEKGLREVGEVFRRLVGGQVPCRLTLAGPAAGEELDYINGLIEEFPGVVEWRGALYAEKKLEWFQSIDIFLFPSMYTNEAYPIVLAEAMAYGAIPFATDLGCIPDMMAGALADGCIPAAGFVERTAGLVAGLAASPALLAQRSDHARNRFAALQAMDGQALQAISRWAC